LPLEGAVSGAFALNGFEALEAEAAGLKAEAVGLEAEAVGLKAEALDVLLVEIEVLSAINSSRQVVQRGGAFLAAIGK
jgi:hypothetical protein